MTNEMEPPVSKSVLDMLEEHTRVLKVEMDRGVEFVRLRWEGATWEDLARYAETTVQDVRDCAIRAFWGVEPQPL